MAMEAFYIHTWKVHKPPEHKLPTLKYEAIIITHNKLFTEIVL